MRTRDKRNSLIVHSLKPEMNGRGKEDEGRVATVYVLSINRFANELMPYIIISPAHRNIISHQYLSSLSQ